MSDDRLLSPIPAPSEAQLEAGAEPDPNARVVEPEDAQPEASDDQRNTSIDTGDTAASAEQREE